MIKYVYLKIQSCHPTNSYEGGPGGFSAYEAIAYKKNLLLSDIIVNKEIKCKNVFFLKIIHPITF